MSLPRSSVRGWQVGRVFLIVAALPLLGIRCERTPRPAQIPPGGVYRSDNHGVTFTQKALLTAPGNLATIRPRQIVISRAERETVYLVAEEGLYVSTSAGNIWERLSVPAALVTSLSIHPRNPAILLISVVSPAPEREGKILKSVDGGKSWAEIFTTPRAEAETGTLVRRRRAVENFVVTISHDPHRPERVYAVTTTGALLASTDGGVRWETRHTFRQGITGMALSPTTAELLFVRLTDGRLARSTDGGTTMDVVRLARVPGDRLPEVLSSLDLGGIEPVNAVDITSGGQGLPDIVYVGTSAALYRSDDGGSTWTRLALPSSGQVDVPVTSVAHGADGTVWASSGAVLFASSDQGGTWRAFDTPLRAPIRFVATDPFDPDRLYLVFAPGS